MPAAGATFVVTTERCPQILCRLLGLVSQQGRLIERVDAIDTRRILRVTLSVADLDARHAAIIAEKMRQLVTVRTVRLRAGPAAVRYRDRADAQARAIPRSTVRGDPPVRLTAPGCSFLAMDTDVPD